MRFSYIRDTACITVITLSTIAGAQAATVNLAPIVDASPEEQIIYLQDTAYLYGSATDPDGHAIADWEWEVISAPGGSTYSVAPANTQNTSFATDTIGDYVITLIATDGLLWSDPDAVLVTVIENLAPTAVASVSPTSGVAPLAVNFDATGSSDPEGDLLYYDWDFGDFSTGVGATPSHEYNLPGLYTASLMVTDAYGNIDFDTVNINVSAVPVPPAVWLFGTGLIGLIGVARRKKS